MHNNRSDIETTERSASAGSCNLAAAETTALLPLICAPHLPRALLLLCGIALHEISTLLNTGLDRNTLSILVQLCEIGVNPGALVHGEF